MTSRATSAKLEPGKDSIDRVTPKHLPDGSWQIDWRYRPLDGGKVRPYRTKAATKGLVRRRAHEKAAELRATFSDSWRPTDLVTDYIDQVSRPAIEKAKLRDASRTRYRLVLKYLTGECDKHRHRHALKGKTIAQATRPRALRDLLLEIAETHGDESAHQARSVLSRYVLGQMVIDEVILASPIAGQRLGLGHEKKTGGSHALTAAEWSEVLDHLLALDPAEGVLPPKRGMYILEDRIAVHANAIDLALLQATTGLRAGEARALIWRRDVAIGKNRKVSVTVSDAVSKTHRGRTVDVLDERVAERLIARRETAKSPDHYVIGSPADAGKPWNQRQSGAATARLYVAMADALGIETLRVARSHLWRATLNTVTAPYLSQEIRAAWFGHTTDVNGRHYTGRIDSGVVHDAIAEVRSKVRSEGLVSSSLEQS